MRLPSSIALLLLVSIAPAASSQEAQDVGNEITVELVNGDRFTGTLVEQSASEIVLDHEHAGILRILRSAIVPPAPEPELDEVEVKSPWSGSFDLSIAGKRGNTQEQDTRVDFKARRETDRSIDNYLLTYEQSQAEVNKGKTDDPTTPVDESEAKTTNTTARRVYAEARREWFLEESIWRPFLQGSVEDDKFKSFNKRLRVAAGGAYPWIENDEERWVGRIGLAAVKEIGGDDEAWNPEALLGMDYFLQLAKDRSLSAGTTIYPSLEDKGEYQAISRAEYRMKLEAENPWTLVIGAEHTENSDPDAGDGKTDVSYYIGAGFVF